jgi:hypothetical protein
MAIPIPVYIGVDISSDRDIYLWGIIKGGRRCLKT